MKRRNIVTICLIDMMKASPFLAVGLLLVVAGVVATSLAPPQLLRIIVDGYIVPGWFQGILWMAAGYFGLLAISSFFEFLKSFLLVIIGQNLARSIQAKMSDKLVRLKTSYYTGHDDGETASYFVNDVNTINYVFANGIVGMAVDGLKIIGILVSITLFSPAITLITCGVIPIMIWVTRVVQKAMLAAQMDSRFTTGKVNNCIAETANNFNMIKIQGKSEFMKRRWRDLLKDNYAAAERVNFLDSVSSPLTQVLRAVVIGATVYLASRNLGITIGMLVASIDLITNLFDPLEAIGAELQSIQTAYSGIKRVNGFYQEEEEEEMAETGSMPEAFLEKPAEIDFDRVSFSYVAGRTVLQDISFHAEPKEKLSIAGRTGVGKTTMFHLIAGLYRPTEGYVTINGIEAHQIPSQDKRRIFAYVTQSFSPIVGTIFEQVSLKDEQVTEEMVYEAMRTVGLHQEILKLDLGYQSIFREGIFSKGQEQLLSIARAIVLKPRILLLDEMSASLDSLSEKRINDAIERVGGDMTSISISHRMSSMLRGDRILYFKEGKLERTVDRSNIDSTWFKEQVLLEQYAKS